MLLPSNFNNNTKMKNIRNINRKSGKPRVWQLYFLPLTEHHQLARCLCETVFVLQLYLDLSGVFSVAPAQQQAALAATSLQLCVAVIMELLPLLVPLHLDGLMANKMHFEDGVVTHFDRQRLSECVEVFGVNPRGIWRREAWVIQVSIIPSCSVSLTPRVKKDIIIIFCHQTITDL